MPEQMWAAHKAGLLNNYGASKNSGRVPGEIEDTLAVYGGAPLPEPTFTREEEWKAILQHFQWENIVQTRWGGPWGGPVVKYHKFLQMPDGVIVEALKVPIQLGTQKCTSKEELERVLTEIKRRYGFTPARGHYREDQRYETCLAVVQLGLFTKERVRKLRRRAEDCLRKSDLVTVIRTASFLGLLK